MLSNSKVRIHVENEKLIMYGSQNESAGCVLRGVMTLQLQEPTKVKSILLEFIGKMTTCYTENYVHGHERFFKEEKIIYSHVWPFFPKESNRIHSFNRGNYTFDFELVIPGKLPESVFISNIYNVEYELKATIEKANISPNLCHRKVIQLCRQLLPLSPEFLEPVMISSHWSDKLDYEITLPSKIYTHGDSIPVSIRVVPMQNQLKVRHLTCSLKEYTICQPPTQPSSFHSIRLKPKTYGNVLFVERDSNFGQMNNSLHNDHFIEWTKTIQIPLPTSLQELHYDLKNDILRICHKIKFILSLTNKDGHISELRAALPVTICAVNNTGLPAYEEAWRGLPYDPLSIVYRNLHDDQLVTHLPTYHAVVTDHRSQDSHCSHSIHPPNYDDTPQLVV